MATQKYCETAMTTLSNRIRESAHAAGFGTVRKLSIASRVQYMTAGGEIKTHCVSRSCIAKIYNLEHYPTFDTLLALARTTGAQVSEWTAGLEQQVDEPQPEPAPEPQPEPAPEPQPEAEAEAEAQPETEAPAIDILALLHGMKPVEK